MILKDSRRRRNETSIELRRQRRDNDLMKRRNINEIDFESTSDLDTSLASDKGFNKIFIFLKIEIINFFL